MPASTFTFYQDFKEQLGKGIHDLSTHDIKVALTNTAPNTATHALLADITQIATGGGYTGGAGGGLALAGKSYTETAGVGTFIATDLVVTAAGGSIGPFRYAVLYNNTAASDNLIGYLDYAAALTLADTETLTLDFTTSIFTVT
jgi:hypothetical protein